MNRLSKTATSLYLIVALIVFTPFFTGSFIKHHIYKTSERINKNQEAKLEINNYHKGFFTSKADFTLRIPHSTDKKLEHLIPIKSSIIHGPLAFDLQEKDFIPKFALAHIKSKFRGQLEKQLQQIFYHKQPVAIETTINYILGSKTQFLGIPISKRTANNLLVEWDGIKGTIKTNSHGSNWSGNIVFPKLKLIKEKTVVEVLNSNIQFDSKIAQNTAVGENRLKINTIKVDHENDNLAKVKNLTLTTNLSDKAKNKFDLNIAANLENTNITNKRFNNSSFDLSVSPVSPLVLKALQTSSSLQAREAMSVLEDFGNNKTKFTLTVPRDLVLTVSSLATYNLYKSSSVGKTDQRQFDELYTQFEKHMLHYFDGLKEKNFITEQENTYNVAINFKSDGAIELNNKTIANPVELLKDLNS